MKRQDKTMSHRPASKPCPKHADLKNIKCEIDTQIRSVISKYLPGYYEAQQVHTARHQDFMHKLNILKTTRNHADHVGDSKRFKEKSQALATHIKKFIRTVRNEGMLEVNPKERNSFHRRGTCIVSNPKKANTTTEPNILQAQQPLEPPAEVPEYVQYTYLTSLPVQGEHTNTAETNTEGTTEEHMKDNSDVLSLDSEYEVYAERQEDSNPWTDSTQGSTGHLSGEDYQDEEVNQEGFQEDVNFFFNSYMP